MTPRKIDVIGPVGSGKSTLARKFSVSQSADLIIYPDTLIWRRIPMEFGHTRRDKPNNFELRAL